MANWNSHNRLKYLLQYHLIFICKFRKKLLANKFISDEIKDLSEKICKKHDALIKYMETDADHIHYMIETTPNIRLSDFVRIIKSFTTFHIWKKHYFFLIKHFWKERTFWSDGYFICSVGNVSEKMLHRYIENQG
jgi:putative transposase